MVLDTSGSMGVDCGDPCAPSPGRLSRVKKAASRFIRYDVNDGIPLGVVRFSADAATLVNVTEVNANNRNTTIEAIEGTTATGGTCLGLGLMEGLEALKRSGYQTGGVLIFLTDGVYGCGGNTIWSSFEDDLLKIKNQKVRVISIAFSDSADGQIETLARETNGISYYVSDTSGPADLNNAFAGALAFLPGGKTEEQEVTLLQETYLHQEAIDTSFFIDTFCGRDVVLQIDITTTVAVTISVDGGTGYVFQPEEEVFQRPWPEDSLPEGEHSLAMASTGVAMEAVSIKVTSKAPKDSLPLTVEGWTRY